MRISTKARSHGCPNIWVRLKSTQEVGQVTHRMEAFDLIIYEVVLADGTSVEVAAGDTEPATINEMLYYMARKRDWADAAGRTAQA